MAMRVMPLPRRIGNAIDNANAGVDDFRRGVTTQLLPLKILIWAIVGYETFRGVYSTHSMAYPTMSSAVEQLWHVLLYSSVPGIWLLCLTCNQRVRQRREWTLIGPNAPARVDRDDIDLDEWVIVNGVPKFQTA